MKTYDTVQPLRIHVLVSSDEVIMDETHMSSADKAWQGLLSRRQITKYVDILTSSIIGLSNIRKILRSQHKYHIYTPHRQSVESHPSSSSSVTLSANSARRYRSCYRKSSPRPTRPWYFLEEYRIAQRCCCQEAVCPTG